MDEHVPWQDLDPGIRGVVRFLVARGFRTVDSGDGRSKFDADGSPLDGWESDDDRFDWVMEFPHVVVESAPEFLAIDCRRLLDTLRHVGIHVEAQGPDASSPSIQGTYDPCNDKAFIVLAGLDDAGLAAVGAH